MYQKSLSINQVIINYYASNQDFKYKTTLIFLHGNSLSGNTFAKQFNGKLIKEANLLAIDFSGHGNSTNANNPREEYHVVAFAKLLDQFIVKLKIESPVLLGHSMGGHVVNQLLHYNKNFAGVILIGTPPISPEVDLLQYMKAPTEEDDFSMAWLPHPATAFLGKFAWSSEEIQMFYQGLWGENYVDSAEIMSDIERADGIFRENLIAEIVKKNFHDEIDVLQQLKIPIAIMHGVKDKLVNLKYLERLPFNLWQDKIHIIDKAGHMPFYENPKYFDDIVMKYISSL